MTLFYIPELVPELVWRFEQDLNSNYVSFIVGPMESAFGKISIFRG